VRDPQSNVNRRRLLEPLAGEMRNAPFPLRQPLAPGSLPASTPGGRSQFQLSRCSASHDFRIYRVDTGRKRFFEDLLTKRSKHGRQPGSRSAVGVAVGSRGGGRRSRPGSQPVADRDAAVGRMVHRRLGPCLTSPRPQCRDCAHTRAPGGGRMSEATAAWTVRAASWPAFSNLAFPRGAE
jgi:hypothetical protein